MSFFFFANTLVRTVYYSLHPNIDGEFEVFQYPATWIVIHRLNIFKENRYLPLNINLKHDTKYLTKDIFIIIFLPKICKNNALHTRHKPAFDIPVG